MQEIIVDEGKIKCLITGKMRKETPEEYVRQEYCRILLDVYKYPKSHIDVEYPIKVGSTDKRCDIVVFNDEEKSQDNIYWIVETKKKDEKEGVDQLWSYMSATTASFGTWTNGDGILFYYKDATRSNRYTELPDIPKYKESVDSIGKYNNVNMSNDVSVYSWRYKRGVYSTGIFLLQGSWSTFYQNFSCFKALYKCK